MAEELRADDRALCHELVLGVLRRRLWLDTALQHFASRRIEGLDLPVRVALRIGLYQLRFLERIPPSAAVNESVNLVRAAKVGSAAGFINAVLRRATREPDETDRRRGQEDAARRVARIGHLGARTAFPGATSSTARPFATTDTPFTITC